MFQEKLPYHCRFLHDSDAAADSELWHSPELTNFVYLNLAEHLGSSLVNGRKIVRGIHGRSSTIEHVQAQPRGKLCYCGKRGCTETLCSMSALLEGLDMNEEEFFSLLRSGNAAAKKRWKKFLQYLAMSINNMHLLYDTPIVLGGYLAAYITGEDLNTLYEMIEEMMPFPEEKNFLLISKMPKHSITIGSALHYIRHFLEGELL